MTVPHKAAVAALVDELSDLARQADAVNTVVRDGDRLVGHNTDLPAIVEAIGRLCPGGARHAVVLGAGGTARAATFALRARGAEVTVLSRTPARAEALARALDAREAGPLRRLEGLRYDVLVNTTPVGLRSDESPVPAAALRAGAVVLDAVYDPAETRLLREARERGARCVGGKWMLVEQAVEQIRLWTGTAPPSQLLPDAFDAAAR